MRVRLRHTKLGKVRFVSHRDLARAWERAIRRAELPIAYSEGFSPRPRMHFGLALSVGHESVAEFIDLDLTDDLDVAELGARLSPCLPDGVDVTAAIQVADHQAALQAVVGSVTWRVVDPTTTSEDLGARVAELLALEELVVPVQRKGRPQELDLRPAVLGAVVGERVDDPVEGVELVVDLATEGRSVRPAELLTALRVPTETGRVRRLEQWMHVDGVRRPPVPADPSFSPALTATG